MMSGYIYDPMKMIEEFSSEPKIYRLKGHDSFISCHTSLRGVNREKNEEIIIWRIQLS